MLLKVGQTETIAVTVSPSNATNKRVTWSSSDESVATVDENGEVTAIAGGTATIIVTSAADSTKKATKQVIVGDLLVPANGSIQEVIDEAENGDVIAVAPSIYEEQLVIDKPLTLLGPNAVFEGYGQRNGEAVITYPDDIEDEKLIRILSDDVEIKGLYFQDGGKTSGNLEAILAKGDNLLIKNNVFEGFSLTQMRLTPESSSKGFNVGFLIEGNLFKNKPIGNFALYIQGSSGVARLNKFENVKNGLTVQPYHHSVGGVVEDNEIEAWYRGIWFNGAYRRAGEWVFNNNTVNAIESPNDAVETVWYGIRVETFGDGGPLVTGDLPSAKIINNTVDGAGASSGVETIGISLHQPIYSDLLDIENNEFTNVDIGGNIHNPDGPKYMVIDLNDFFPLNTFLDGSQVIGNKIMVPEEGKVYNQRTGNEYDTIQAAVIGANDGDTILVGQGTYEVKDTININKAITIKGVMDFASKIKTWGGNPVFTLSAAATLDGIFIDKEDKTNQHLVTITANDATIKNSKFVGQYEQDDSETTRAIVPNAGVSGLTIEGNYFESLRQPGYLECTGTVANNFVKNTRGWVICVNYNLTLEGNTFADNAVDIAIIANKQTDSPYYKDIATISAKNNGAYVENQLLKVSAKDGKLFVDDKGNEYANSIENAVKAAKDNDTILILGSFDGFVVNKPLTIKSGTINSTTIPATSGNIGVYVPANVTGVVLEDVQIVGTTDAKVGIETGYNVELTVKDSEISNFTTGIYLNPGSVLTATNNIISDVVAGIGSDKANLTGDVSGNTFNNCTSEGIGLYLPIKADGTVMSKQEAETLATQLKQANTFQDCGDPPVKIYGEPQEETNVEGLDASGKRVGFFETVSDALADETVATIKVYPGDHGKDPIAIVQREGVNITLEAVGDVVLKNQILIYGSTRSDGDETLTIKGFTFDLAGANDNIDIISAPDRLPDNNYSYAHNIKIENNTFIGNPEVDVVAIKTFRAFGLEISNCKGINLHSLAQIRAQSKHFTVSNCTVTAGEGGINYYGPADAVITGLTVDAADYGIRAGQSTGTVNTSTLTISNSNLDAQYPIWLRGDAPGTVTITGSTLTASEVGEKIRNDAVGVNVLEDPTVYNENLKAYYMTIQDAITDLADGDTLTILSDELILAEKILFKNNGITIQGQTDADGNPITTIKGAGNDVEQFRIEGYNVTVRDLIFDNIADGGTSRETQGVYFYYPNDVWQADRVNKLINCVSNNTYWAIFSGRKMNFEMEDCTFTKSGTTSSVFMDRPYGVTIKACSFSGQDGYALHIDDGVVEGVVDVSNCNFTGGVVTAGDHTNNTGAGNEVYTFTDCNFYTSSGERGGWYASYYSSGTRFENCTFDADFDGAGTGQYSYSGSYVYLDSNCTWDGNPLDTTFFYNVGDGVLSGVNVTLNSEDEITGGIFVNDPTAKLADGYVANMSDGTWVVSMENSQTLELTANFIAEEEPAEEEGPDFTPINTAIQEAIAAKGGLAVSEDGTDLPAGAYWVTQEDMDAIDAAIAAAEAAKESAETQQDAAEAVEALEAAVSTFNDAKQEVIDEEEIGAPEEGEEQEE